MTAAQGEARLICTLLDWKTNIDARDKQIRTALHLAAA